MTWEVWCHCFWLFTLLATGGRHRRSVFTLNSLHRFRLNEIRSKYHLLFDVFKKKKTKKSQKSLTTRSKSERFLKLSASLCGLHQWMEMLSCHWDGFLCYCGILVVYVVESPTLCWDLFFCQTGIFKVFNLKQAKCFNFAVNKTIKLQL